MVEYIDEVDIGRILIVKFGFGLVVVGDGFD